MIARHLISDFFLGDLNWGVFHTAQTLGIRHFRLLPRSPMFQPHKNKKVLGKFKAEINGKPPKEIAGLRAKCYSVLDANDNEKSVAKWGPPNGDSHCQFEPLTNGHLSATEWKNKTAITSVNFSFWLYCYTLILFCSGNSEIQWIGRSFH